MKKCFSYSVSGLLLIMALSFFSCQEEFEALPQPDEQQTIMASSSTAELIMKTSSNDGSYDNIVDGASCLAIQFPYTVNVNGVEVSINAREDIKQIEAIFDELEIPDWETGSEILDILFPITITLSDFSQIAIENQEDFRALIEECREGGDDDDIECIDFVYPLNLYTFDLNEQQTGSVVVESDMDMRLFFKELGENDLISIDFPLSLKLYNGTEIQVNSNAELANAIETARNACDEDDDNDHNDDDFTKERLDGYLVECPWLVLDVERDGILQTEQYIEYAMDFSENGEVSVKDRLGNSLAGTWTTRVAENKVLLKLEFDVLTDFNLEWYVYELEEGKIKFYSEGGNRIILKRACDIIDTTPDNLRAILAECSWVITKVKNQGEEIRRLIGYEFNFMAEGMVTLGFGGSTAVNGTWEITTNAQGRLVLAINMESDPAVSFEWPLTDLRDDRLKFSVEDIGYELVLQRVCDGGAGDNDVVEIRNILMAGDWMVAQYQEGELLQTETYSDFSFAFGDGNLLEITTAGVLTTQTGIWRILRDSDGKLKFYLNAGATDPLGELTEDWEFVSIAEGRLEVKDIDGDGSVTVLVFEKL